MNQKTRQKREHHHLKVVEGQIVSVFCDYCNDSHRCPYCNGRGCPNCGNLGKCPHCYEPGG